LSNKWIKPQQYKKTREDLIDSQDGLCAVLRAPLINPVLDHSHKDCLQEGYVRGVLESIVNLVEGHINKLWKKHLEKNTELSLPEFLRNLADYLDKDVSDNPLHYGVLLEHKKWISRWRNETIIKRIVDMDRSLKAETLNEMNKQELTKMYLELIAKRLESE
jgi:hypothetical protein